jgi:UDP-N-acetylglucosamine 2-epimerase (non-hydrolysing)
MTHEVKIIDPQTLEKKIALIVGTRPGIVIFAPIIHEMRRLKLPHLIIHTGQHYSPNMDAQFFQDLELPAPDYRIEGVAEKKTHGAQTAAMLEGLERVLLTERPRLVVVGGDANTNLAGALAARKLWIQIAHVEAGERTYDWRVPEEHNRRMIDHISEYLLVTNAKAKAYLEKESVMGQIYITGNTKVDASMQHMELAKRKSGALERLGLQPQKYLLLTAHREENVDFADKLRDMLLGVSQAGAALKLEILFPAHPRTLKRLREFELSEWARSLPNLRIIDAVGYLDFLNLLANARLVFTDSGGVQQEACINQIPAVTLHTVTEWTETLEHGANRLAGTQPADIVKAAHEAYDMPSGWPQPFGDGRASEKIVAIARQILEG